LLLPNLLIGADASGKSCRWLVLFFCFGVFMDSRIQVGSILIEDRPTMTRTFDLEIEPYARSWSLVRFLSGRDLERKIRAAGWNFLFIAGEVKVKVWGAGSESDIQTALMRIAKKKRRDCFNCLEVTAIIPKRFLGLPYTTVSAHCRHIQPSSGLDNIRRRRTEQEEAEWARG